MNLPHKLLKESPNINILTNKFQSMEIINNEKTKITPLLEEEKYLGIRENILPRRRKASILLDSYPLSENQY